MKIFTTLLFAAALWTAHAGAAPAMNVVFILADDLRPDALACMGNPAVKTPNLDRLAAGGTRFTRATCGYPICHVSRAEILTGRCLVNADMPGRALTLEAGWTTWPEAMRRAGWHTAYSGKWHTSGTPKARGYVETSALFSSGGKGAPLTFPESSTGRKVTGYTGWTFKDADGKAIAGDTVGLTPETDARIADGAIAVIRARAGAPFFLHVNFTAPHDPLLWPAGAAPRKDPASLALPENFRAAHPFDHGNIAGRDEIIVPAPRTAEDVQRERAVYFSLVENLDTQAGRILRALEEAGVQGRTLVIFSSDHGLALGSHGLMGKQNQYEHTIGVPLILAGPGVDAGARVEAPCYLRDLFPTVCEMTGTPVPPSVQGRSLLPAMRGGAGEAVYPAIFGRFTDTQRMMRTADGWKVIWYPKIARHQLFHVSADPAELHDLAGERDAQPRLREMIAALHAGLREQGDALAEPIPQK